LIVPVDDAGDAARQPLLGQIVGGVVVEESAGADHGHDEEGKSPADGRLPGHEPEDMNMHRTQMRHMSSKCAGL
jgi:hypothetical protein